MSSDHDGELEDVASRPARRHASHIWVFYLPVLPRQVPFDQQNELTTIMLLIWLQLTSSTQSFDPLIPVQNDLGFTPTLYLQGLLL